jgi:hypothetical protein
MSERNLSPFDLQGRIAAIQPSENVARLYPPSFGDGEFNQRPGLQRRNLDIGDQTDHDRFDFLFVSARRGRNGYPREDQKRQRSRAA